jgi:biopolymer transport protein ExbD
MKKFTLLLMVAFSVGLTSQAQSMQEKLDKQAKDPKTAENAAKADVYVSKDKSIFDSTSSVQAAEKRVSKKARKNKTCRKKSS